MDWVLETDSKQRTKPSSNFIPAEQRFFFHFIAILFEISVLAIVVSRGSDDSRAIEISNSLCNINFAIGKSH